MCCTYHTQEFEVFQIEISKAYGKFEWHEDIKKVLKMAGEANQKVKALSASRVVVAPLVPLAWTVLMHSSIQAGVTLSNTVW